MNRSASGPISRPQSAQSRSRGASASRGRRFSQISDSPTTGSGFTTRSRSASYYGGPPHRPGNNVQIILPAPLAPQAAYAGDAQAMYNIPQMSRSSVFADQWLTAGNNERNSTYDDAADMPRVESRSQSRHRVTASVPNAPPNPAPSSTFRRAASQHSPASRSRSTLRKQSHDGGAVPEVPPKHSHLADLAESAYEDDAARGRSRAQTRLETIPSGQIPPPSTYSQPYLEQQ
ncbi:hypothetical protein PsYK624_020280 [Phanerochaete sordida]|uniref:Uncharacterized protein n=1 Tax=Phanerochaete sordida TaxID=48140 RepID=A0A9P3L9G1_9APHY|nr:hypothetical protein PsYK624_020280 [Phanerochaete sordida]